MNFNFITSTDDLNCFCHSILSLNPEFIAIDTEFISGKKYPIFPKLSLIQINCGDLSCVIDILSERLDLSTLKQLLYNPNLTKVFHDAKQDVLALLTIFDYVPYPIMDTQIMASMCNNYDSYIGYSQLVYSVLNIKITKSYKKSDWLNRPLSDEQIKYALADVVHLYSVYKILHQRLSDLNRLQWAKNDMNNAAKKLDFSQSGKLEKPNIIRKLLCDYQKEGRLIQELSHAEIYRLSYLKCYSKTLLANVIASDYVYDAYKLILSLDKNNSDYKCSGWKKAKLYLAQFLVHDYCIKNNISYYIVTSTAEIDKLINNDDNNLRILSGWRYEQIGKTLVEIFEGKRSVHINLPSNTF